MSANPSICLQPNQKTSTARKVQDFFFVQRFNEAHRENKAVQGGGDKTYILKSHIKSYKTLNSLRTKYWTREQINFNILNLYSDFHLNSNEYF